MPKLRLAEQYTYKDMLEAYLDCRKRKRSTRTCISYEVNFERNLIKLQDELNNGTYQIGRTRAFVVTWPKAREVWAALFRDRIVHHLICRDIAPYFEARFIEDSFACLKGRGPQEANTRVEHFCRSATQNWSKRAWLLQVDISNFFVSIRRDIIWDMLKEYIGETSLTARLAKMVIFHDPTINPIVKPGTDFNLVPRHKSLWHCPKGCGLPIGNLTSQFLANFYLDGFDKYVKHVLKAKYYARYVDDAVFIAHDREQLKEWRYKIDEWLQENRNLRLHPKKVRIAPVSSGIDFVGHMIRPFHTTPRTMTVGSAFTAATVLRSAPLERKNIDSVNSYLGLMRHSKSYALRQKICTKARVPHVVHHDAKCTKLFHI